MRRALVVIWLLVAVATVWGCRELGPEEKVAQTRARYSARLNSFFVRDVPVETMGEPAGEMDAGTVEEAEGDEPAGDEGEMMAPLTRQEVTLDIIVQHDAAKALPGITLDITLVDADENPKGSWRIWVETEGLPKANQKQITHILEDVGYVEGDGFSVEVRRPIPAEERGEYREFSG